MSSNQKTDVLLTGVVAPSTHGMQAAEPLSASVDWAVFLAWLEQYCWTRGWEVEYDAVSDGACTIFTQEARVEEESKSDLSTRR